MSKEKPLDIEIDFLTNSIRNAVTDEVFDTEITVIAQKEIHQIKKNKWVFDWHTESKIPYNHIYKLTTVNNPDIIHGLVSITDKGDHIFMNLIENAAFNRGTKKMYHGVAGNLVAFCCKLSFEHNYEGYVSFIAKSRLMTHYQNTLGAQPFKGNRMFIGTKPALVLVKQYFKDWKYDKL